MKIEKFNVPSIHCQHCVDTIKTEFSEIEGVNDVSISLEEKVVNVTFNEPTTKESIKELLIEINYPVE